MKQLICTSCKNWNHWHDTPEGTCDDPRCECTYRPTHNHFTRDIKPQGKCPSCDRYWDGVTNAPDH